MTIGLDYQRIILDEDVKLLYRFGDDLGSTDTAQLVALRREGQRRWNLGLTADNAPFAPIATSTALGTFTFIPNPEEIIRALGSKHTVGIYDDVRDYIHDLDVITESLPSNPDDTFIILEVSQEIRSERGRLASQDHGFTVAFDDPVMLCTDPSSDKGDTESTLVLEMLTSGCFRVLAEPVPVGFNQVDSADRIPLASSSPETPLVFTELDDNTSAHPLQLRSGEPLTTPMSVSEYLIASCQAHQIRTRPASDGFTLGIAEVMTLQIPFRMSAHDLRALPAATQRTRLSFHVEMDVESRPGQSAENAADELAELFTQHLTDKRMPFFEDYGIDPEDLAESRAHGETAGPDGYDGPFAINTTVTRRTS